MNSPPPINILSSKNRLTKPTTNNTMTIMRQRQLQQNLRGSSKPLAWNFSFILLTFILVAVSRLEDDGIIVDSSSCHVAVDAFVVIHQHHQQQHRPINLHLSKTDDTHNNNGDTDNGEIPTMDWLTNDSTLMASSDGDDTSDKEDVDFISVPMDEDDATVDGGKEKEGGFVPNEANPIPTTGVSVADEMMNAQRDRYYSEVVPIVDGMPPGTFAAQIASSTTSGSYEAVRYLIRLSVQHHQKEDSDDYQTSSDTEDEDEDDDLFVMVDVPPFSPQLLKEIQEIMTEHNIKREKNSQDTKSIGRLAAILITSEDAIHANDDDNDDPAGVYSTSSSSTTDSNNGRKKQESDLVQWMNAFPEAAVIANRMDVPRYCRDSITQRLDGYGPWASVSTDKAKDEDELFRFIETGRPLVRKEWDPDIAKAVMNGKMQPPEVKVDLEVEEQYSPEAIRKKEEGKHVLAVFTPGRTYGSTCYVFPKLKLCACGYTVPLEDARDESNVYMDQPGPALDFRGYITTCKAGVSRQMDSARNLVNGYSDRFEILLPSRGDPFFLEGTSKERKQTLSEIINQYDKLGQVYEQLGIL